MGDIRTSLANFGDFDYGTSFIGRVHYPNVGDNARGCQQLKDEDFPANTLQAAKLDGHRKVIMVDRGKCHFVLKAMHAQKLGAIMLLVVDDKKYENPDRVIMADDGRGSAVKIPTFLISWEAGQAIKDALKKDIDEMKKDNEANGEDQGRGRGHPVII